MKNTIIHLLGFQGTGKSTIAKELCKLADIKLVDNHSVYAPIMTLIHEDGITPIPPRTWDNISKIWEAVHDTITYISPTDYNFVITNNLINEVEEHKECTTKWQACAKQRNGIYIPVRLTINIEENKKRITQPERTSRQKETNPETPANNAKKYTIIKTGHPYELTLDVTTLSAKDAAKTILDHIKN